jgi:hypothetical protein
VSGPLKNGQSKAMHDIMMEGEGSKIIKTTNSKET